MTTTLLITTYNWTNALEIVLMSVENLTLMPDEIIIADDGSTKETEDVIKKWQNKLKTPIIHSWQEDIGFRAAASRNKAIAKATGDYIIMIDGDLILHPNFIKEHIDHCKMNQFTIGTRVLLKEEYSKQLLAEKNIAFSINTKHILANSKNKINNSFLSKFLVISFVGNLYTKDNVTAFFINTGFGFHGFERVAERHRDRCG